MSTRRLIVRGAQLLSMAAPSPPLGQGVAQTPATSQAPASSGPRAAHPALSWADQVLQQEPAPAAGGGGGR
ncbi:MAG: hypothetical protein ABIP90_12780 [Vicinamibacterales bacterium]